MRDVIIAEKLTKEVFAPYGDVIEKENAEQFQINNDNCTRYHALAKADVVGEGGAVGINIFSGKAYSLPLMLDMVERHPLGSQAFYPLGDQPWLVSVCRDEDDRPVEPKVFLASANQGINLHRGTWHGVLTPLCKSSDFLVIDRIGAGDNLQEYYFETSYAVKVP